MTTILTEEEILAFLHAVENGEIVLTPVENPQEVYTGEVVYFASNRWSVTVRISDNAWQHIEGVSTDGGRESVYQNIRELPHVLETHVFETYRPSEVVAWIRYGLPSWGLFRCVECGEDLRCDDFVYRPAFHCIECGPFDGRLSYNDT